MEQAALAKYKQEAEKLEPGGGKPLWTHPDLLNKERSFTLKAKGHEEAIPKVFNGRVLAARQRGGHKFSIGYQSGECDRTVDAKRGVFSAMTACMFAKRF